MKTQIQTRIGLAVGLALALLVGLAPRSEAAGYEMPITFSGYTNRTEALTNFPVLVVFSNGVGSSGFNFSSHPFVTTNGYDLRFYTNTTDTGSGLNYEIESWNTNAASYVWVQVPLIPTNGSGSIYAKWGDTAASNQLACTTNGAVWTNGFSGVYHFRQGSSAPDVRDSSTNAYHGGNNGATSTANGFVGYAANFPGGTDPAGYVALTNGNKYLPAPNTPISVSTWFKADTISSVSLDDRIITIPRVSGSSAFIVSAGSNNKLQVTWNPGTGPWPLVDATIASGTWYHMAVSFNGSQFDCYLNGSRWTNVVSGLTNNTDGFKAALSSGPGSTLGFNAFDGLLDEFQISSVFRSSNWVWATYANVASNAFFNGYGTVIATAGGPAAPQIQNLAPTGVATNGATFNGYLLTNGFESAAVYVAWGQTNGVWTTNWWAAGAWTNGSYPATNITLEPNANYYYRFGATNSLTNVVASGYQYLITGEVTVQPTDPTGRVTLADTAAFTVSRPASCTNETLTVAYTLGGTATNLTHYTNSPAVSVTNGTVTILAGQTNAVITVYPLNLAAPEQTVVLSLVSSNYALGAANSATCTLVQVTGLTYNDKASGNWNVTSTWNPSTGYPGTNDTAVIDSHTVSPVSSLLTGTTAPVSITLDGTGVFQSAQQWTTLQVASPITLNGGTIRGAPNNGYRMQFNGPISVTGNGTWDAQYLGYLTMAGAISGAGTVTAAFTNNQDSSITLSSASNTNWTGTLNLTGTVGSSIVGGWGYGVVGYGFIVRNSQGLGSATVNIGGAAPQPLFFGDPNKGVSMTDVHDYRSIPAPRINVSANGRVMINNGYDRYSVTVLGVDIALNGGTLAFGADGTGRCGGRLYVTNGVGNVYGYRNSSWNTDSYIDSEIIGAGRLIINAGGKAAQSFHLTGNNTNFSGGITLRYNNLYVRHTNALGSGECWFNATGTGEKVVLTNGTDWALGNNLGGINTIQVENGTASYRLTSRGATIQPGSTNNAAGKLTVDGAYAFAQADGGQCATLRVDVAQVGSVAGTHYDQLKVDHGDATLAASITNCVLALNMTRTEAEMNGVTAVVLSAPGADFSAYAFASVTGTGAAARVIYTNGSIAVTWDTGGPVISNAGHTNLAVTSCDVLGNLVSTGKAPTEVYVYWGTNDMATGAWANASYLGTNGVGMVTGPLTGLTSNTKYYYRFYATNAFGDNLALVTSNFTTLGDAYWNDATNGNWKANDFNTWGAGANVYPQNVLNDHVTVDSHVVSVDSTLAIVAADVTATTNAGATGTLSFVNAAAQNQSVILAGGRLGVYSDAAGANDVVLNGSLRVKSASTLDLGANANRLNGANSTMNGSVMDYGPGTTGVLRVDGGSVFGASGRLVYNGVSTNFTGGWLIQSADSQALDGGFWLGVQQDGGLGASTVTVNRGWINIKATQSGTAQRPAPARVIVNPGGYLYVESGVNVTNWTVDLNGGQLRWYSGGTYAGGALNVASNSVWSDWWGGFAEYAGTISGAGRIDMNPAGGKGPFMLSGNNSGWSGGLRLLADSLTVTHTNGLGTGPVLLASQSGGTLTLDRTGGNFDWTLANDISGGCTNGSTAVAIRVEDGAGNNTLTVLGTVDPGTNGVAGATNIVGILRVDGDLAFGAGSRLKIDITGTNGVAGQAFDRLLVDHDLTGLANAVLEVNVNTNLVRDALSGQELMVVSNAASLAGATFLNVQLNAPWRGKVKVNEPAGTVKLYEVTAAPPAGMVLMVQ